MPKFIFFEHHSIIRPEDIHEFRTLQDARTEIYKKGFISTKEEQPSDSHLLFEVSEQDANEFVGKTVEDLPQGILYIFCKQCDVIEIVSSLDGCIEKIKAKHVHYLPEDLFNDVATQKGWPCLGTYEPEAAPRGNVRARGLISSRQQDIRDANNIIIINVFTENKIKEIRSLSADGETLVVNNGH